MELDELKSLWEQQTPADVDAHNKKIIDMIQSKSYGPIASLRSFFKRGFIILPFLIFMIGYAFINKEEMNDPVWWMLLFMLIPSTIFYIRWYYTLGKLQKMELPMKATMERDVVLLERGLRGLYICMHAVGLIMIIVMLEVLTTHNSHSITYKWHFVPEYLRYLAYIAFGIWSYFSGKKTQYRYFGRDIDSLKDLLSKMG